MSEKTVQTVTPRQIRKYFNRIGLAFLAVFVLSAGAFVGYRQLLPLLEPAYRSMDRAALETGAEIVLTLVITLLPFSICAAVLKLKVGSFFGSCRGQWKRIGQTALVALAVNLLLTFITGILAIVLSWLNIQFSGSLLSLDDSSMAAAGLNLVLFLVIYPLCEEFVFRGVCLRAFSRMGNLFAIFASSLLFALMHGNTVSIFSSFFIGVLLAMVAMRYRSIVPTLVIHMLLNAQNLLLQAIPARYSWLIGLGCLVIYVLAILAFFQLKQSRLIIRRETDPWVLVRQFFLSWAIVLTIVLYGVLNLLSIRF